MPNDLVSANLPSVAATVAVALPESPNPGENVRSPSFRKGSTVVTVR
jgi:hypothetical protein